MTSFADVQQRRLRSATRVLAWVISLALSGAAGLVHGQSPTIPPASTGPMIYPAKGQSAKQKDQDKYECYDWARGQTGFDPAQMSQPAPASQPNQSGAPAGGMVRNAAGGAAIAELTHRDAGRGAAAGVVGGSVMGRIKERQAVQAGQQQAAQQQAVRGQQRANYDRAFGACMEGRGYTVK